MSANPPKAHPELLAPAGDWDCLRAAWENGADAVYFGLESGFNARARAKNFSVAELPEIAQQLHLRGVKGYVTLNTLVFDSELAAVEPIVAAIAAAGLDAVLVQDLGLVRLIRAICPDLPIHASTQMTMTSAQCIDSIRALGIERVVLARELSLDDIRRIGRETTMPIEVFVHGALCVAYSGQCLTSESLGGRSANRGQCAQACRLPYDLVCDGVDRDLGDQKYLLSPQDLAAFDLIPQLLDAGVCSFKIEGRLKTPEYVANIVRHYRQAIDDAVAHSVHSFTPRQIYEMEMSFSRGFSPGWLHGCDHKRLVPALSSAKRGVRLGEVLRITRGGVEVALGCPIRRGDGIVFAGDRIEGTEFGGRVYQVFRDQHETADEVSTGVVELRFERGFDLSRVAVGQSIWKTDDPQLNKQLRSSFASNSQRKVDIDLKVRAEAGERLQVHCVSSTGIAVSVESSQDLEPARQHPLTETTLREQLGRLGRTVYRLNRLEAEIVGAPMIPLSVLGDLRRRMIEQLENGPAPSQRRIASSSVLPSFDFPTANDSWSTDTTLLVAMARDLTQLDVCLDSDLAMLYADFADIRQYRSAVEMTHQRNKQLWLATPRIQKPDEMGIFRLIAKTRPDGVLVRNLSGLQFFQQESIPVVVDFSLNVANRLTAQYFAQPTVARITPSFDLNRDQLLDLVAQVPPHLLEIVVHQHMPMFHMEHCVFCAVLSPGTNKTNCGRPCDRHLVKLRDRMGVEHPLTADVGCRNTLFNATPQSGAEIVPQLIHAGVGALRVEFLDETPDQIRSTIELYRQLIDGRVSASDVWRQLRAANQVGVTRGTLEPKRNPLAII